MPSAQGGDEDVAVAGAVELAEEDPLPASEAELAVVDRNEHLRPDQRTAHMGRRVRAVRVLDVLPRPAVIDDLLQRRLEVAGDEWVGALVDRHPGGRVRYVDERCRGAVRPVERLLHLIGDVDELGLALGPDLDRLHAGILGDPGWPAYRPPASWTTTAIRRTGSSRQ